MTGLLIIFLIIILTPYVVRWIRPLIYRWMQRRAENYMRQAMGMPPRDKSSRKSSAKASRNSSQSSSGRQYSRANERGTSASHEPLIPKEYAEDVSYTEIHSYSEETVIGEDSKGTYVRTESQVSDAEIIEIKK